MISLPNTTSNTTPKSHPTILSHVTANQQRTCYHGSCIMYTFLSFGRGGHGHRTRTEKSRWPLSMFLNHWCKSMLFLARQSYNCLIFYWPCIIMYHNNVTNLIHFLFYKHFMSYYVETTTCLPWTRVESWRGQKCHLNPPELRNHGQ
jgi:hypothetical protein